MHTPPDFDPYVTTCARTINITCRSTLDGVPDNSVYDRAQTVAMEKIILNKNSFVEEISIWMHTPPGFDPYVTACARTINITYYSTTNGVSEISVQDSAQTVATATKHSKLKIVCRRNLYLDAHFS